MEYCPRHEGRWGGEMSWFKGERLPDCWLKSYLTKPPVTDNFIQQTREIQSGCNVNNLEEQQNSMTSVTTVFLLLLLTMLKHNLLLLSLASFLSLDLPGLWTSEYWDRILFPLTLVCSQMSLLPFPPFFAHFSLQNLSSQEAILYSTLSLCSSLERFLTWLSEFHFRGRAVSPKPCPFVQSLTFESYSSFFLNALQSTVHVIF